MHILAGDNAMPAKPPTFEEIAEEFGGPVFAFVDQPALRRASAGVIRQDGLIISISVNYSYFANPDDIDDPVNLAFQTSDALGPIRRVLPTAPAWLRTYSEQMKYPFLAEAVKTWAESEVRGYRYSLERLMNEHLEHFVRNNSPKPGSGRDGNHFQPMTTRPEVVDVDGFKVNGIRGEHKEHVVRGAIVGSRALTAVIPEKLSETIDPRFTGFGLVQPN